MHIHIEVTDLIGEAEGGWSANGCWVDRYDIEVPDDLSDLALSRRILKACGFSGWGFCRDDWSGAEWSWRKGSTGIWAEVVD